MWWALILSLQLATVKRNQSRSMVSDMRLLTMRLFSRRQSAQARAPFLDIVGQFCEIALDVFVYMQLGSDC